MIARKRGRWRARLLLGVALMFALGSAEAWGKGKSKRKKRGDSVDKVYAAGTKAAADGHWKRAAKSWEKARRILPQPNAQLSYDLGTAYAHLGELGHATVHLERARRADARLAEDALRNLAIVRRQAEISAAAHDRELSAAPGWSERVLSALASTFFAWLALVSGWTAFTAWLVRKRVGDKGRGAGGLGALTWVGLLVFLVSSVGHAVGRDSASVAHEMIVLDAGLAAREGPGSHQAAAFEVEGGSRVFEEERRSGWVMVRLPGGLAGWVEEAGVIRIDAKEGAIPVPRRPDDAPN